MTLADSLPDVPDDTAMLVEGKDDFNVVWRIADISEIPQFLIYPTEGIDNLLDRIENQINFPGRRVLGIIVDADDAPNARWQAVSNRLSPLGITLPQNPDPAGTIIPAQSEDDLPRIGVWLWPDNLNPGELEDFIISLIPENDPVWPLSEKYIDNILAQQLNKFTPGKKSRAQVHAWLAAREDPRRRMGQAIEYGDLNPTAPSFVAFATWLTRLFVEPA